MNPLATVISSSLATSDFMGRLFISQSETRVAQTAESPSWTQNRLQEPNRFRAGHGEIGPMPTWPSALPLESQHQSKVSKWPECPKLGYGPFILGHNRPSPDEPHSLIFDQLSKEILHQFEESMVIEGLRRFLVTDVEKAREILKSAVTRFPESQRLQRVMKLLSPSKVLARPASGASRKADFDWIKANWGRFRGQWVALYKGQCLASGKDLATIRNNARKQGKLEDVLITFFPEEKDSEASPES